MKLYFLFLLVVIDAAIIFVREPEDASKKFEICLETGKSMVKMDSIFLTRMTMRSFYEKEDHSNTS
mgnify:CR=1 FL=1